MKLDRRTFLRGAAATAVVTVLPVSKEIQAAVEQGESPDYTQTIDDYNNYCRMQAETDFSEVPSNPELDMRLATARVRWAKAYQPERNTFLLSGDILVRSATPEGGAWPILNHYEVTFEIPGHLHDDQGFLAFQQNIARDLFRDKAPEFLWVEMPGSPSLDSQRLGFHVWYE